MDSMETEENNNIGTCSQPDYDEPVWKSARSRSTRKQVSYSRKNTDKFLDENRADRNRELFKDLFDQDPDESVCDNQQFEKELFSDIKDPNYSNIKKTKKQTKKRATKKKANKDDENAEFLTDKYQSDLEKKKAKLQEIFEKSSVYQNLQALKDLPLNIEEVDYKGDVVKRYEYYFDFDENKHDIVEVKRDEYDDDSSEDERRNLKNKAEGHSDNESAKQQADKKIVDKSSNKKANKQADKKANIPSNNNKKRKQKDDDVQKSASKRKRPTAKSTDEQQVTNNERPSRSTRNVKRKSYIETEETSDEDDQPKRTCKTTK